MWELLRQWSHLEPERCFWSGAYYTWNVLLGEKRVGAVWGYKPANTQAYIQAAAQEAIEARDIGWIIGTSDECGKWFTRLHYPRDISDGVVWETDFFYGDSPAEALLKAYLQTLSPKTSTTA